MEREGKQIEQQEVRLAATAVDEVDPGGQQRQHAGNLEAAAQHHLDAEIGKVEGEQDAGKAGELGGAVELAIRVEQQRNQGGYALIQRDQGQQPACDKKQGCLHRGLSRRTVPV